MIYNIVKKAFRGALTTTLKQSYGELIYTTSLSPQSEFNKVPTYRLIDLNGHLLVKDHTYDTKLLAKILKTMIFVDEMDSVLLRVKGQGILHIIKAKYLSTCLLLVSTPVLLDQLQDSTIGISSIPSTENKEPTFGEVSPFSRLSINALGMFKMGERVDRCLFIMVLKLSTTSLSPHL